MQRQASERKSGLLAPIVANGARTALALTLLFAILWLTLPLIVSPERLGKSLQDGLLAQEGVELRFASPPRLSLWPSPSLTLADVSLHNPQGTTFLDATSLSVDLSLLNLLAGSPRLEDVTLNAPRIHVPAAWRSLFPETGRDFLRLFMTFSSAVQADQLSFLKNWTGKITIHQGSLIFSDNAGLQTVIPNLEVTAKWPSADSRLSTSASAEIAGERVQVNVTSERPYRLLAGTDAPATLSLDLPGAMIKLNGTASLAATGFFTGALSIDASDLETFFAWYGHTPAGTGILQRAKVAAQLSTSGPVLRFDQLSLGINDTQATGIMDIAMRPDSAPKFTGTLAFDDFDIGDIHNLIPVIGQFATADDGMTVNANTAFDLRLSARTVHIDDAVLGDVAASMLIGGGHVLLDIGDSDFEGGRLTGRLSFGSRGDNARLLLSVRNVDMDRLAGRLGLAAIWPSGAGSLDLSLTSHRPLLLTRRKDLSGKATLMANNGKLRSFAPAMLRTLAARSTPLALSDAGTGAFEYDRLDTAMRIEAGTVFLDKAVLESATERLRFGGEIKPGGVLAVTGTLSPLVDTPGIAPVDFTLSGSRKAPMLAAVPAP